MSKSRFLTDLEMATLIDCVDNLIEAEEGYARVAAWNDLNHHIKEFVDKHRPKKEDKSKK